MGSQAISAEALKDMSRVPLGERLAWTPAQAAQMYSLNYLGLLWAINNGDVDTCRPPNRFGKPGKRKVTRGPVYTSAAKEGLSARTGKKYHPHCGCTVEVVYDDWRPTEKERQWIDDYYRAAESLPKGTPRTQETVLPILRRNGAFRDSKTRRSTPEALGERRKAYAEKKAEIDRKRAATLAEALGSRGAPMGIEDADRGNANPGYWSGNGEYGRNCQSCVPAYEMRRRGYDVIALPLSEDNSTQMAIRSDTTLTWRNPDTGRHPTLFHMHGRDATSTERRIAGRIKPGQRYAMHFGWKGKNNGHIVVVERVPTKRFTYNRRRFAEGSYMETP